MKRLVSLCLGILFTTLAILSCANFIYGEIDALESDMCQFTIEKPNSISNSEFLNTVNKAVSDLGKDIMFKSITVENGKPSYIYFKTNNSDSFLDIDSEKGNIFIDENESISTIHAENDTCYSLYTPAVLQNITIRNWFNATDYNLSQGIFYCKSADRDAVLTEIKDLGYSVSVDSSAYISGKLSIPLFSFIPSLMLIISMVFYSLSLAKKNVLKKFEGYTSVAIIWSETKENAAQFGTIFLVVQLVTLLICGFMFGKSTKSFLIQYRKYIFIGIAVLALGIFTSWIAVCCQNKVEQIKGKVPQNGIYNLAMLAKCAFLAFFLFFISVGIRNLYVCVNTYQTAQSMMDKIDGYVTMPIYGNYSVLDTKKNNYYQLYQETEQSYNGILVDSSNYSYDIITGKTLAELYNQVDITVNENYLDFNPVYDISGQAINGTMLENDKVNVLIPAGKEPYIEDYTDKIPSWFNQDANFIIYDSSKSKIYSYNADVQTDNFGEIKDPVIIVANESVIAPAYVVSCISSGEYFIHPNSDSPYKELLPLLKKLELDDTTRDTPYLSAGYQNTFKQMSQMLAIYATQSLILFIGIICLIIFTAKLFCANYRMKIVSCIIDGYSPTSCCMRHLVQTSCTYLASLVIILIASHVTGIKFETSILIITYVADMLFTAWLCNKYAKQNLYSIIKGAV